MDNLSDVNTTENPVETQTTESQTPSNDGIDFGIDEFKHENGKIFGKFNDIKGMASGYRELEKEFSKKNQELSKLNKTTAAPDKYEFALDEDIAGKFEFDETHPDYQKYIPMFKEMGLSNEKVNKLVNAYARDKISEGTVDFEEEMVKAGGEKGEVVQSIKAFMIKNPDLKDVIADRAKTADDLQLIASIIKKSKNIQSIPAAVEPTQTGYVKSKQDYRDEAFAYQKEHERTIGYNKEQQDRYNELLSRSL